MERNEIMVQKSPPRGRQMDRVEQVVRSLPGIVSARAEAGPDGELGSIHVLVSEQVPRYRITRAIHSALLIYLDLAIDDHQIEVAVSDEGAPEENGASSESTPARPEAHEAREPQESAETRDPPEAQEPRDARKPRAPRVGPARSNGAAAHDVDPAPIPPTPDAAYAPTSEAAHTPTPETAPEPSEPPTPEPASAPSTEPASQSDPGGAERQGDGPAGTAQRPDPRPQRRRSDEAPRNRPEERVRVRRARALHLGDYRIESSGRGAVRVRVDVDTEHGRFEGEVPAPDLDSLSLDIFAEAATIAAERGLIDDFPSLRRPGLRVLGIEKTRVLGNVHLAVAVSGYLDDGNRTATGFAPVARDAHRAAALAALDAVERLLQHDPRSPGFTDPARNEGSEIDPFGPWSRES